MGAFSYPFSLCVVLVPLAPCADTFSPACLQTSVPSVFQSVPVLPSVSGLVGVRLLQLPEMCGCGVKGWQIHGLPVISGASGKEEIGLFSVEGVVTSWSRLTVCASAVMCVYRGCLVWVGFRGAYGVPMSK